MTGVRLTALVLLAITAAALLEQSSTRGQASISVEGWVLPFDTRDSGSYGMLISNAPGIPGHLVSNGTALDIDYAPDTGSSVPARSPADGVVLDIFLRDPADEGSNGGFGNILRIDHGGIASFFAHLKDGSITVGVGDRVSQGQIVAEIGDTGVGGAHLHFGAQAGAVAGDRRSGTDLPLNRDPRELVLLLLLAAPQLLLHLSQHLERRRRVPG
jgi:murein DD-endopeptidase MepM/ murein hydrolase activator NlpD